MQNRIDPFGNIISTKARGGWMGNRGLLHNAQREIIKPFKLQAWIICKLAFKNRWRPIMEPGQYTELFFWDEATALAAGHRPCFECRREDAQRFKDLWIQANPAYGFGKKVLIGEIDKKIHDERMNEDGTKKTYEDEITQLPDGVFVSINNEPNLIFEDRLYPWTPYGYKNPELVSGKNKVIVLTPKSVVNAIKAGYKPQVSFQTLTSAKL